jgi:cytochrome d ubiquinol oxidase subunit I
VLAGPLWVAALIAGWVVTEVGRQPWVVYRVMPTDAAVTGANGIPVGHATLACAYLAVGGGLPGRFDGSRAPLDLPPDAGPAPRVA